MSTIEEVKEVVAEHLKIDKNTIDDNANLIDDLGADSLDITEMVMDFETKFDIEINDEDVTKMKTIKDIVSYIDEHLK